MRPTIYDIAAKAGVSITTVSRVINGNYPVSERTRARVLKVINEHEYSPNHVARSLATNSTQTIGIVGAAINNPYFVEMIDHIQSAANEHDLQILLQSTGSPKGEIEAIRLLLERRVDGVIMIGRHEETNDVTHLKAAAEQMPVVMVGQPLPDSLLYSARCDDEEGAYRLGRFLLELGHRDFLFLGGSSKGYVAQTRLAGLRRALNEEGSCRLETAYSGYSYESALVLNELLDGGLLDRCTAVVAVSDWVAVGALDLLYERGILVPQRLTVTGFDNIAWCRSVRPPLTSVEPDKARLAHMAVETVVEAMSGKRAANTDRFTHGEIVPRASHGPGPYASLIADEALDRRVNRRTDRRADRQADQRPDRQTVE